MLPHGYVPDGITHFDHLRRRYDRYLSTALRAKYLTAPFAHLFSSFVAAALILSLTFFHARINPCKQHPWGVANRHDHLVYVRLTVCNALSQDLTEPDRPSSIYGVTWLQVYSYYTTHCSKDRWPLKSFVRAPTCFFPCPES